MRESIRAGIALLLPLTVGLASGLLTSDGVVIWYPTLLKPSFTPPLPAVDAAAVRPQGAVD